MTPDELLVLVMVAGIVALAAAWSLARWRRGARDADPGARLLASVAIIALGWIMGASEWSRIGDQLGLWFWVPFAIAVALFAADWIREGIARRRP